MKKLIFILFAVLMASCHTIEQTKEQTVEPQRNESQRFVIVETQWAYVVVYDKDTKVMYVMSNGIHNIGNFTLLVDSLGKPVTYK